MKALLVLVAALALAGCDDQDSRRSIAYNKTSRFVYTQDAVTNLCFAWYQSDGVMQATYVPCTPEVMQQVKRLDRR